jgi:4-hydroxybenzoate polyprenyltransferase
MADSRLSKLNNFFELVKFSHTIFLFPFALASVVLAHYVRPITWGGLFWIVVALVAARTSAMVINRLADLRFDAQNPRTANRVLVTGQVSQSTAWFYLAISCAVFILASWQLSDLCLLLSPVALAWIMGYSYSKRFTSLCHIWLGAATALAPVGAWIAVSGAWDWRAVVLAISVTTWVAGFDVIYACQDLEFDQNHRLHSLPARLGLKKALWVSRGLHLISTIGFFALAPLFGLGSLYLAGVSLVSLVLVLEQIVVAKKRANIPMAFFTMNGIISVMFLIFLAVDCWIRG